ncbi:hypothetical protein AAE478_002354 [Parahypoxylon ruwenzoriense]
MRFTSIIAAGLFAVASAQTDTALTTTDAVPTTEATGTTEAASSTELATNTGIATTTEAGSATGAASTTINIDPAQSSAQTAVLECLNACSPDDVNCQAKCIAVPSPDTQNVNATTECVANCPQGNGTAADNLDYANCVNGCIAQYFYTSTGTPNLQTSGGSSGTGTATATPSVTNIATTVTSDGSVFVTSFSSTVPPSGTGSADSASSTSSSVGAADILLSPVGSGIGLFSFLAAFLAL